MNIKISNAHIQDTERQWHVMMAKGLLDFIATLSAGTMSVYGYKRINTMNKLCTMIGTQYTPIAIFKYKAIHDTIQNSQKHKENTTKFTQNKILSFINSQRCQFEHASILLYRC